MEKDLIASCGMNCALCARYLAFKNNIKKEGVSITYCEGCRLTSRICMKKRCKPFQKNKFEFCYECQEFPCKNMQIMDKRYQTNYRMSMIENLKFIKKNGMKKFLAKERKQWKCKKCGEEICCHNGICFSCGFAKLKTKKKMYRWEDV